MCGPGDIFGVALVALLCFPTPLGASRPLHCWERLSSTRCSLGLLFQQGTALNFGLFRTWHRCNLAFFAQQGLTLSWENVESLMQSCQGVLSVILGVYMDFMGCELTLPVCLALSLLSLSWTRSE